jgi:hypothetical protein
MAFDYFDDLQDFYLPDIDAAKPEQARKQIIKTLNEFKLRIKAEKLNDAQLRDMPGHVLFAWQHDRDLALSLYAIPEKKLSKALAGAMQTASNKCYTYHEMSLADDRAKAFVRIDAAMGVEGFDVPIEGFAKSIDKSDRNCLADYRIAYFESDEKPQIEKNAFDKRFVAAYAVKRSQ